MKRNVMKVTSVIVHKNVIAPMENVAQKLANASVMLDGKVRSYLVSSKPPKNTISISISIFRTSLR